MINVQADFSKFTASLVKLKANSKKASKYSLWEIGNEILRLSQFEVPHDKGTLQNSGNVEKIGDDVIVGYHTPYAARLHEHPEYNFGKGRKGKYLEDPIIRNASVLGLQLSKSFK